MAKVNLESVELKFTDDPLTNIHMMIPLLDDNC